MIFFFAVILSVIIMGGDGTACEVLSTAVMKQQGKNITDLKPLNITVGMIPTGQYNIIKPILEHRV